MKNLCKYVIFLIGGVIWLSVLLFSIYTDISSKSSYNPSNVEDIGKR